MSLIPIEEFEGTVNGNAVIETLVLTGLLGRLRQRGYTLSIEGVQPSTPTGYIEDCTDSHNVTIEKIEYIGKSKELAFIKNTNKVDKGSEEYNKFMAEKEKDDLVLKLKIGMLLLEGCDVTLDANGDTWYKHVYMTTTHKEGKTNEQYVIDMFETIANAIKGSKQRGN